MAARACAGMIALAAAVVAPVAHAQASCEDVRSLLNLANTRFASIMADEIELDVHQASFTLPGVRACHVLAIAGDAYQCFWEHDSAQSAAAAVRSQTDVLERCLSGWTREPVTPTQMRVEQRVTQTTGERFRKADGAAVLTVTVWSIEMTEPEGRTHEVAFEVARRR